MRKWNKSERNISVTSILFLGRNLMYFARVVDIFVGNQHALRSLDFPLVCLRLWLRWRNVIKYISSFGSKSLNVFDFDVSILSFLLFLYQILLWLAYSLLFHFLSKFGLSHSLHVSPESFFSFSCRHCLCKVDHTERELSFRNFLFLLCWKLGFTFFNIVMPFNIFNLLHKLCNI